MREGQNHEKQILKLHLRADSKSVAVAAATTSTKMKSSSLTCVVLVTFLVSTATALKCFHCNNCENSVGTPYECSSSYEACMKISVAGRIEKSCAQKLACGLGSVERGVVTAWNKIKNFLSDVDVAVTDGEVEAQIMHCCDEDYCNSATTRLLYPILLLLPALICFLCF